jgi:hypothetical protein
VDAVAVVVGIHGAIAFHPIPDAIVIVIGVNGIRLTVAVEVGDRVGVEKIGDAVAVRVIVGGVAVAVGVFELCVD